MGEKSGYKFNGFSGFTYFNAFDKVSPFFRYDSFDKNTDDHDDAETHLIGGLEYKVNKKFKLAFDYQEKSKGDEKLLFLHTQVKY